MLMKRLANTTFLLAATLLIADAHACGEVMYRMGGALRYHAFVTRHPAQILIFEDASAQHSPTIEQQDFHQNLEKAGHFVTVAQSSEALRTDLAARHYDVIIAYAGDMSTVKHQLANVD